MKYINPIKAPKSRSICLSYFEIMSLFISLSRSIKAISASFNVLDEALLSEVFLRTMFILLLSMVVFVNFPTSWFKKVMLAPVLLIIFYC